MPDDLYHRDALAWAVEQADLLRRLAAGERVNDAVDWANVIEEVHDVGQALLRSCRSLLQQGMVHLLKLHAWPDSDSARAWKGEVATFLDDAALHFAPSMRQYIQLQPLYDRARRRVAGADDASGLARPLPSVCPYTLDALLEGDVAGLLEVLRPTTDD